MKFANLSNVVVYAAGCIDVDAKKQDLSDCESQSDACVVDSSESQSDDCVVVASAPKKTIQREYFDSAVLAMKRIFSDGEQVEAKMIEGKKGLAVAVFGESDQVQTEMPNALVPYSGTGRASTYVDVRRRTSTCVDVRRRTVRTVTPLRTVPH